MALRPSKDVPEDDPVAYYSVPTPGARHLFLERAQEALKSLVKQITLLRQLEGFFCKETHPGIHEASGLPQKFW